MKQILVRPLEANSILTGYTFSFFSLYRSTSLVKGSKQNRVVVTKDVIGTVTSIRVKYVKARGTFGFGRGKDSVQLSQVSVQSGDNGDR